jgi:phage terminase large subunit-like protein
MIKSCPAYQYARSVLRGESKAPKYVILQCSEFVYIASGKSQKYMVDEEKLQSIESLLALMVMPKGLKAQQTVLDALAGFQWLFIVAVLCTVYRDNRDKRRYQTAILEICRKNGKTFLVAVVFLLLFLTEPRFSKFYSVAPDGSLSREVKSAIEEIIRSSPALLGKFGGRQKFKILRDSITCNLTENAYFPLNYSNGHLDGKLPSVFLADEVGALPNSYALEAMRSGQLTILNKLGCVISTKYPKTRNPFEDEVAYAKKILDDVTEDETVFSLLYEPDDPTRWMDDDLILIHGNPLALEVPEIMEDLKQKRKAAIEVEGRRENFLCKHCNIIYQGVGTETYIPVSDVQACRVKHIDWSGREVYVGVDLSMTEDNTAVAMVALDGDGKILADVTGFIPEGRIDEKNRAEKTDYRAFISAGHCVACGDRTIDYAVVEDFVFDLERRYGVKVLGIGFDRYNCLSSAQKWENGRDGQEGYPVCQVKQHSSVLHPATKWLKEKITDGAFAYEKNELLEDNFENARCTFDTNMNRYVNKKKSSGKVDMVVALINAVYMLQQNTMLGEAMSWSIQVL